MTITSIEGEELGIERELGGKRGRGVLTGARERAREPRAM